MLASLTGRKVFYSRRRLQIAFVVVALLTFFYAAIVSDSNAGFHRLTLAQILRRTFSTVNVEQNATNAADQERSKTPVVVCMIHTTPWAWSTRGRAVRHTWAYRCPIPLFIYSNTSKLDPNHEIRRAPDAVGVNVPDGREHLTAKTLAGLEYSYKKYGSTADWYMKADDDTYVIWENLEEYLTTLQTPETGKTFGEAANKEPAYVGRVHFRNGYLKHGYTSGGGGYLVSSAAAKLLVKDGPEKKPDECSKNFAYEDRDIGRCLASFGVYPVDTVDKESRLRFHSDNPVKIFAKGLSPAESYYIDLANLQFGNPALKSREEMLSRRAITFHYVTPEQMYMFDYLLYHLNRNSKSADFRAAAAASVWPRPIQQLLLKKNR